MLRRVIMFILFFPTQCLSILRVNGLNSGRQWWLIPNKFSLGRWHLKFFFFSHFFHCSKLENRFWIIWRMGRWSSFEKNLQWIILWLLVGDLTITCFSFSSFGALPSSKLWGGFGLASWLYTTLMTMFEQLGRMNI